MIPVPVARKPEMLVFMTCRNLAAAAVLAVAVSLPARAEPLVIEGQAAQALHCSALLFMASRELHQAGLLPDRDYAAAQARAVAILDHVPGTDQQKVQAMRQRFDWIRRTRDLDQMMDEFKKTAPWCHKAFLQP